MSINEKLPTRIEDFIVAINLGGVVERHSQGTDIFAILDVTHSFTINIGNGVLQNEAIHSFDLRGDTGLNVFGILHVNAAHDDFQSVWILRHNGELFPGLFVNTGANPILNDLHVSGGEEHLAQNTVFPFAGDGAAVLGGLVFHSDLFQKAELDRRIGLFH